ncbi:MAG: hypothetical protein GWP14_00390 [Actinobacteria bacterium]|nr:hypothetical protein [Actinomycetota bacterium]
MSIRQLWQTIMNYGDFDRMPVIHWGGWDETRARWISEGMPENVDDHTYFQATPHCAWISGSDKAVHLYPPFEEEVLEDTKEYRIYKDECGVTKKEWKHKSSPPHCIDFTLKTGNDWSEFKKRLQPCPERIPPDLAERIERAQNSGLPLALHTGSMMGWIRDWMGVENMSYLMYDDPEVYSDMMSTLSYLVCWYIDQVAPKMRTKLDMGFGWEDICGKSGPLVSPAIFKKHVAPGYRKIRNKLEEYGTKLLAVDCDGFIEPLLSDWLDAGVNVQCPVEIGTWNADPMALRKKYGKELRIIGGFNKLVLEKGPEAIDVEIERRLPLMKEGGFVVMPDHLITPDTSLANYKYYLNRIRELRF